MRKRHLLFFLFFILLVSFPGCGWMKDTPYTPSEAEKKLVEFCKKEGAVTVVTRQVGKTLWIYLPINESIFSVKPSPMADQAERKKSPFALLYLGTTFDEAKNFAITYDMVRDVLPPKPVTYGSAYNDNYTKCRHLVYQALQETIFNVPGKDAPLFVVVMIADITTGVATRSTIYLADLKGYITEVLPPDEYYMREQNEVVGDEALVGDKNGKAVKYADIRWPDFLSDQMETRIRYRFTQGSITGDADSDKEIAAIAANTLRFYPFNDYSGVYLYNTRGKKDTLFDKAKLKTLEEKNRWEEQKGRLTTIHFDLGSPDSFKKSEQNAP